MRWLSRLVTVVVIIAVIVGVLLLIRSKMPDNKVGGTFHVCALFRDGTRLATGSPVMIAGVRVGEITNLSIEGGLAKIDMTLSNNVEIPADSWVTKRAYSPFGDSYIEIIPSPGGGARTGMSLRSGECFYRVLEGTSTDTMLRSIAGAMDPIDDGLERVHQVTQDGRKWAKGVLEERISDVDKWIDEGHIDKPVASADKTVAGWAAGSTDAAKAVNEAKPGIAKGLDRAEKGLIDARKSIADFKVRLQEGLQNAREGMNAMDKPVDEFAEVVAAINEGRGDDAKGQFGRFVNDPELGDTLDDTTTAIRDGIGVFSRFKVLMGFRVEWNIFASQPRWYVTAEVKTRTDKFYYIEIEKGPLGAYEYDTLSDAIGTDQFTRRQQIKEGVRFTAQFGKRIGWFQFRGGLKESTFGFGADMLMGNGRLKISADLFGSYQRIPRLKLAGALAVFKSFYLIGGIDDVLNTPGYLPIFEGTSVVPQQFETVRYGRDYFLGAQLQFHEDDVLTMLRLYGALLLGLI